MEETKKTEKDPPKFWKTPIDWLMYKLGQAFDGLKIWNWGPKEWVASTIGGWIMAAKILFGKAAWLASAPFLKTMFVKCTTGIKVLFAAAFAGLS